MALMKKTVAAAGLLFVLAALGTRAHAHNCACGWSSGGQNPTSANSWILQGVDLEQQDGCDRQTACMALCNRPTQINQADSAAAAAVAAYCATNNFTGGQVASFSYVSQAGGVIGGLNGAGNLLNGCIGWQNAGQPPFTAQCPGGATLPAASNPDLSIDSTTAAQLSDLRDQIRPWAVTCPGDGTLTDDPVQDCGAIDFGDMTMFSGLSCASGEASRCSEVARSQGPNGRWWRNPPAEAGGPSGPYSFSRDATYGLLNYFLTLRETNPAAATSQAKRWFDWVQNHGNTMCSTPVVSSSGVADTCMLDLPFDPATWAVVGEVMNAVGVHPIRADQLTMDLDVPLQVNPTLLTEADVTSTGYQLHLVGLQAWLLQRLRREYGLLALPDPSAVAKKLAYRQNNNAFFAYLYHGRSEYVAQKVLSLCPAIMPGPPPAPPTKAFDWAWQRDQNQLTWKKSMGWDCIFMVNLLLGPGPVRPPHCVSPQFLNSAGVCQCPSGTSPLGTNLAGSEVCACPNGQTFVNGACANTTCPTGQTFNTTRGGGGICCPAGTFDPANGGQCDVSCPSGVVFNRRSDVCCSPGQGIDANGDCACPSGSQLKGGSCQCNILAQSIIDGACTCTSNGTSPNGMVVNSQGMCACPVVGQNVLNNLRICACPSPEIVIGNSCMCPNGQVPPVNGCVCPNGQPMPASGSCPTGAAGH